MASYLVVGNATTTNHKALHWCVSTPFVPDAVGSQDRALAVSAQPQTQRRKAGLNLEVCNSSYSYRNKFVASVMLIDSAGVRDVGAMSGIPGAAFGPDASMGGARTCF